MKESHCQPAEEPSESKQRKKRSSKFYSAAHYKDQTPHPANRTGMKVKKPELSSAQMCTHTPSQLTKQKIIFTGLFCDLQLILIINFTFHTAQNALQC